jgi:putative ATPase
MDQDGLFDADPGILEPSPEAPLAARIRPTSFDEFFGQEHLVGPGAAFRKAVEADRVSSIIFWGPPGVGKTTLAELVARRTRARFERVSAVSAGVADLRKIVESAKRHRARGERTILFIDEIHRFNKAQQDAILPYVEDGVVTLIGATTENPSFEVISALLSRSRVYVLNPLSDEDIRRVVDRAKSLLGGASLTAEAEDAIVNLANGDARSALNMLELCAAVSSNGIIDLETVTSAVQQRSALYDKDGEMHFDLISALHKSVRGSDVDASIYWLARMLDGGEDPLFIARRVIRMASEDVGLADPRALPLAMAAQQAIHFIGMPEGALALAEAVAYMALAPKSNALYMGYGAAVEDVKRTRNDPVPLHLRNAPTKLMKGLGYGSGYVYAHDFEGGEAGQVNLPDALVDKRYYEPTDRGFEAGAREIVERVRALNESARREGAAEPE